MGVYPEFIANEEKKPAQILVHITIYQLNSEKRDVQTKEFQFSLKPVFGDLVEASLHSDHSWILLIWKWGMVIWNYETCCIEHQIQFKKVDAEQVEDPENDKAPEWELDSRPFLRGGGFFPDVARVWILLNDENECVRWGSWNYADLSKNLVMLDHTYWCAAVLHPSGKLLSALWIADVSCGYLIHKADPRLNCQICESINRRYDGYLENYEQPRVSRSEYECFLPAFSPDGIKFAFCVNPSDVTGTSLGTVCAYDVMSGTLLFEFPKGTQLGVKNLEFWEDGRYLVLTLQKSVIVLDANTGSQLNFREYSGDIIQSACHPLSPFIAVLINEGSTTNNLEILINTNGRETPWTTQELQEYRQRINKVAMEFERANEPYLRPVNINCLLKCEERAIDKAIDLRALRRFAEAENILHTIVKVFPSNCTAWLERANLLDRDLGLHAEGEECFSRAVQSFPSGWLVYNELAWRRFKEGDIIGARDGAEAMIRVGSLLFEKRKEEISTTKRIVHEDPREVLCYGKDLLAVILTQSDKNEDVERAIAFFEECISLWQQVFSPYACYYSPKWYKIALEKAGREVGVIWELENRKETDYAQVVLHFKHDPYVTIFS